MWPYWLMFCLPIFMASSQIKSSGDKAFWWLIITVITVMIGFRFQVGGDWFNYLGHFNAAAHLEFSGIFAKGDPAYYLINWLVAHSGWPIYWVNAICSVVVVAGLSKFALRQPLPALALVVAVPYLITVVAMGYTRQGTALGCALLGLTALGDNNTRKFVFWVLVGALFHKTAVLLLPIAALASTKNRVWTYIWVGVTAVAGAYFLAVDSADVLYQNYVVSEYGNASQGGQIRVFMNAVPSIILILYRSKIFYNDTEKQLWLWLAIFSLATIPALSISSTAVDRLALYFIPIQMFVFSRLPLVVKGRSNFNLIIFAVVGYYAFVQFVWLNYSSHSYAWLPYKNALFLL